MSNILKAIINTVKNPITKLDDYQLGNNRINNVGVALEEFIKDAFANTIGKKENQKLEDYSKTFSYLGNQNNPPDIMLKDGDAIEIKKIQSSNTALALNSSYPKAKIFSNSKMITKACREAEDWNEKDMIFVIGHVKDHNLKRLWMIYGDCFAADKDIYERIKSTISNGIKTISNVEFTETKELGKVKKVDPLGITDLRIRGMWHIANPNKIFNYLEGLNNESKFELISIISDKKFQTFPKKDKVLIRKEKGIKIKDILIKNPNNPAKTIDAKQITYNLK